MKHAAFEEYQPELGSRLYSAIAAELKAARFYDEAADRLAELQADREATVTALADSAIDEWAQPVTRLQAFAHLIAASERATTKRLEAWQEAQKTVAALVNSVRQHEATTARVEAEPHPNGTDKNRLKHAQQALKELCRAALENLPISNQQPTD